MEQRIIDLEHRFRQFIMRGVVVKGLDGGPYTVSVRNDYGQPYYIPNVLYMPFVTEIIFEIPSHDNILLEETMLDYQYRLESEDNAQNHNHPGNPNSIGQNNNNHTHITEIPIQEHDIVTIKLPVPKIDDRVIIWSPSGNHEEMSLIIGKWKERVNLAGEMPRSVYISDETVLLEDTI